jgi:hypothetical protein
MQYDELKNNYQIKRSPAATIEIIKECNNNGIIKTHLSNEFLFLITLAYQ